MSSPIRVLVVDDSAFMRKMISEMLDTDGIEVVATARNGKDALKKLEKYDPDLATLDVEMPEMDGLEFLQEIMPESSLPVIMLSNLTSKDNMTTIKALELGAVDFIPKPSGPISLDIDTIEEKLIKKVKVVAESNVKSHDSQESSVTDQSKLSKSKSDTERQKIISRGQKRRSSPKNTTDGEVVIIGASTGGPKSLKEVVTKISSNFDIGILIVQHMPPNFTTSLAQRLDRLSQIKVKEAEEGDIIKPGQVLLAPGGHNMLVKKGGKITLSQEEKIHNVRPAVDLTMESAVEHYGSQILGVILTGMGKDGTCGLDAIKSAGGYTIAQDENSSVVYGMPRAAYEAGVVDSVKPLSEVADEIIRLSKKLK
ncbi:protein-glutamate methylesterase/protein-glutamine glutaminase [Sporohalobacter salinus]|uniref:protein-glutamate methylesterase/protein-glutamine glutaminase n=1 Tax=Sporohalobacter salinus TaxID=1494606 RepID=UPI00195FD02B|nr:chemotaxis response regulator protein-glutamate methylesterase [Sporohalobacter salinus]MBM7623358.1 two-component system chemotaxis response regulator CheB [Sporohalobacter salinus]